MVVNCKRSWLNKVDIIFLLSIDPTAHQFTILWYELHFMRLLLKNKCSPSWLVMHPFSLPIHHSAHYFTIIWPYLQFMQLLQKSKIKCSLSRLVGYPISLLIQSTAHHFMILFAVLANLSKVKFSPPILVDLSSLIDTTEGITNSINIRSY